MENLQVAVGDIWQLVNQSRVLITQIDGAGKFPIRGRLADETDAPRGNMAWTRSGDFFTDSMFKPDPGQPRHHLSLPKVWHRRIPDDHPLRHTATISEQRVWQF
jgi:hypothetical protein